MTLPPGEVAVIGLARSGVSACRLLVRSGAKVYASDAGDSSSLRETTDVLRELQVDVQTGGHDLARIARAGTVVLSPGVPPDAPPATAARQSGVPIISEVELALMACPTLKYIVVTGTNGKTTTTAVMAHLLQALGLRAMAGGNIGNPLTEIVAAERPPEWVALELSSFQLHDTPSVRPRVGVLTNLSPNHLDRYKSVEDYYGDKKLLFRNAVSSSEWVLNGDDLGVLELAKDAAGAKRRFSLARPVDAFYDRSKRVLVSLGQELIARDELALVGDHNVANALAATLAVMVADPDHRTASAIARLREGLRTVHAMEHRTETVGELDGVLWVNDSKSTNVASTLVALQGMTRRTVLLLGGRHKGEPYTVLADELRRIGRAVVAFGEAGALIEKDLRGVVPLTRLQSSFKDVVSTARRLAQPGDAVLLSPACSSFDMFANYEERGKEFKRLVAELTGG